MMEGGTGVYYQAMPAVGPDGKNVMKLIPVQKVNGQFYQTPFSTERDCMDVQLKAYAKPAHPPAAATSQTPIRLPSLQPIADGRFVLKTLQQVRTVSNTVKTQNGGANNLVIHSSKQVHVPLSTQSLSQYSVQLPPQPTGQGMMALQTLPVTVKSPVLPNGHFLQIPPNAKVRTLPATALPQSIKCRIMNSVNNTPNLKNSPPTVVLVSPVNSVKLNSDQQVVSVTKPSQIQKTLLQNPPTNLQTPGSVPKTNEEVNGPLKWVVQEGTGACAPCLVPVTTPNVNSDTLKTVKDANSVGTANEIVPSKPTPPQTSQEKITAGKDNALVMCNGKVYFVAKKNSEIAKDVMISEGEKRGLVSTSPALPASSALGKNSSKQDPKRKVSEIIDLCDDEEETSTCLGGAPGNLPTLSDEDSNVIFVSYIPPKSETSAGDKEKKTASQSKSEEVQDTQTITKSVSQNEGEKPAHAEIEKDSGPENPSTRMSDEMKDKEVEGEERAESSLSCLSENMNMEAEKDLESGSPPETRCQDATDSILETPQNVCVQATYEAEKGYENPDSVQRSQPKTDSQLRREFGITSDVQIRLQRSKPTVKPEQLTERLVINKRTLDGLRKVIQESKLQSKIQQMMQVPFTKTEEDESLKVKRKKLEQDGSQDNSSLSSPASQCSFVPTENSLVCKEEVCSPAKSTADKVDMQSEMPAGCTGNTGGFPSSEQKAKQTSTQTLSPSSQRKISQRSKKGKMCTACPCGTVLGTSETTSSLHSQDRLNVGTAVESHKGTRKNGLNKSPEESRQPQKRQVKNPDPVKKAGKKQSTKHPHEDRAVLEDSANETSNDISPDSTESITSSEASHNPSTSFSQIQQGPHIDNFPTQSLYTLEPLDAEEIKRRERIERLKDLLKEKQAALERMQRSMNI